jgi:hypothetical protein
MGMGVGMGLMVVGGMGSWDSGWGGMAGWRGGIMGMLGGWICLMGSFLGEPADFSGGGICEPGLVFVGVGAGENNNPDKREYKWEGKRNEEDRNVYDNVKKRAGG